ncbi:MAG: hypothetical protein RR550_00285 [Rikenellaceae bacterium]
MKKIIIAFAALMAFTACSEDEIETYTGTPMVNFGFMVPNTSGVLYETQESQFVNFVENPEWTEQTLKFRVSISDINRDYDRTIYLKYSGNFDVATQTKLPKTVIMPANKVILDLNLAVMRPAEKDAALDNVITITLDSKDGLTPGVNGSVAVDISLFPSTWVCKISGNNSFAKYVLGEPSKVKNKILTDLYGTFVMDPAQGMAPNFNPYKDKMTEYVKKYNEDPTKYGSKYGPAPMKDEKGKIVIIGN